MNPTMTEMADCHEKLLVGIEGANAAPHVVNLNGLWHLYVPAIVGAKLPSH